MSDSLAGAGDTMSGAETVFTGGTETLLEIEKRVERRVGKVGRWTWRFLHELPGHGAVLGGALGLAGVMLIGLAELVTASFTAYVSYRIFAYGESLPEAIQNSIRFQKGKLPKEEMEKPKPKQVKSDFVVKEEGDAGVC
jgi:hypothetical protein